jgi:dihydroxyacetone kinase-like protein
MELGMGIHGESGAQRLKLLPSRLATDLAFGQLFRGTRALDIKRDDNVLLLVNNLGLFILFLYLFELFFSGGCSNLEFGIIVKDAIENLEHRALHVKRVICGEMMTSFNMKGFSLTVLKLTTDMSVTILNLLDSPTDAFSWPKTISPTQLSTSIQVLSDSLEFNEQFTAQLVIK